MICIICSSLSVCLSVYPSTISFFSPPYWKILYNWVPRKHLPSQAKSIFTVFPCLLPVKQYKCIWFHVLPPTSFRLLHLNFYSTWTPKNPISRFFFMHFEEKCGEDVGLPFDPFTIHSLDTPSFVSLNKRQGSSSYGCEEVLSFCRHILAVVKVGMVVTRYRFLTL